MSGLVACGNSSSDSKNNPDTVRAKSLEDSPTPYSVADADRTKSVDQLLVLHHRQMIALESQLIAPATEDMATYADFLTAPNTGLARLFPRTQSDSNANERKPLLVSGGGSYYQFKGKTNNYGYGSDIEYSFYNNKPQFSVGFAGVDFGFYAQLVRQIFVRSTRTTLRSHLHSLTFSKWTRRASVEQSKENGWIRALLINGVTFKYSTEAVVGMSYVVRSVNESGYDIVAVL